MKNAEHLLQIKIVNYYMYIDIKNKVDSFSMHSGRLTLWFLHIFDIICVYSVKCYVLCTFDLVVELLYLYFI